ncbi:MAG: MFS transporter [Kordiimonas sp.]
MCFGFMGIQFGFALQNSNISRIFQTLGANIDEIPILFIAAPITGLLVQPIIGYMSDRTWNKLGRRRPYFLYGALLATASLFIMPHSPYLWMAAGMLWIMDASINVSMEPFRALVGDMLPEKQRTTGFAMQSFFIGVGSVVASAMPWVLTNWMAVSNDAPEGIIPDSVRYSFYFGGAALFSCVLWTIFRTKEYSPEQLAAFEKAESALSAAQLPESHANKRTASQYQQGGTLWLLTGLAASYAVMQLALDKELYILSGGAAVFGLLQLVSGQLKKAARTSNGFFRIIDDIFHMPHAMKQLALVQFFSWFAMFALWIYTIPAVTSFHFGAAGPQDVGYGEGANWAGILFAIFNLVAMMTAIGIPKLAAIFGRKKAHLISLSLGGIGLASFPLISAPELLVVPMIGVGVAWTSILSLPYALLSSAVPAAKMGTYMGIFNFFIVIPQIIAASILGLLVRDLFGGEAIYALVLAGGSFIISGVLTLLVKTGETS